MRKPKLGDIVIYQEEYNDYEAIIVKVNAHDICDLHVMLSAEQGSSGEIGCWSFPSEEKKQCDHEYVVEHWATASMPKTGYQICKKCKEVKESPPINAAEDVVMKCINCSHLKEYITEKSENKANELLDIIYNILRKNPTNNYIWRRMETLIKEYKDSEPIDKFEKETGKFEERN